MAIPISNVPERPAFQEHSARLSRRHSKNYEQHTQHNNDNSISQDDNTDRKTIQAPPMHNTTNQLIEVVNYDIGTAIRNIPVTDHGQTPNMMLSFGFWAKVEE